MKYDNPSDIWIGIQSCPEHPDAVSEECEGCDAELTARSARIEQMAAAAQDVLKDITTRGGPSMPPTFLIDTRLEVLIDSVLTEPRDRMRFEGEVGRRAMLVIKQVQQQHKSPTLHVPGRNGHPSAGGNVRPLRP